MVPVLPLLPSNVSEVLLTLCDHWPLHDPAHCCSSVTEQRGPQCRASSSRTHTHVIGLWLPGNSFILVWLNLWFWKKKKKKPHLVILPLLTTILCYPPHCWAPLPSVLPAKDTAFRHTSQLSPTHQWHTHRCSFPGPRVMISPFLLAYN